MRDTEVIILSRNFQSRLLAWYDRYQRALPWRSSPPDPYHVLVSEAMLQQTQVGTVIPYFNRFIEHFPSFGDLARADEQQVLRLWQGLGYYSRARNLRAAAAMVMDRHGGQLPSNPQILRELPGIGRYTAGAIASIAFGKRSPILDGNVARVLCRLDRIEGDPSDKHIQEMLWRRAEEILPRRRVGEFNSALMELGATVCTPRNPKCLSCPVRKRCQAFAAGVVEKIPPPRVRRTSPLIERKTYCIRHGDEWLIEQRPPRGRWAGMWQFVTTDGEVPASLPVRTRSMEKIGELGHTLTHRRYRFEVFTCTATRKALRGTDPPRRWTRLAGLEKYPLPRPHLRITEMLRSLQMTPDS